MITTVSCFQSSISTEHALRTTVTTFTRETADGQDSQQRRMTWEIDFLSLDGSVQRKESENMECQAWPSPVFQTRSSSKLKETDPRHEMDR